MKLEDFLKEKCSVCGKMHGQCDPAMHPAWKIYDGCYTHEIPADTPISVTFKAIIPPNLKVRVISAEHAIS